MQAGTLVASAVLLETMAGKKVAVKDKLKAAGMVLDRGGLPSASEHRVTVTQTEDRVVKLQRLVNLAKSLGQDPKMLLGNLADAIEGDFTVLADAGFSLAVAPAPAAQPVLLPEPLQRDKSAAGL